jgi:hypothetical protein
MLSTTLLLAASIVVGQAQAPTGNYEHLKQLEWIVGTWEAEVEAREAGPGFEAGQKVQLRMENEWQLQKNIIAVAWTVKVHDFTLSAHQGIIGYDAANERVVSGGFDSLGGYRYAVWSGESPEWMADRTGAEGDGKKVSSVLVLKRVNADTFTTQSTKRTEDGEELEDEPPVTWKRVK